jgi:pimeloyl-ACP methyl ester carboxylesterase
MPVRLAEPWIRRLAAEYFVVTWESRALFGAAPAGAGTTVAAQTGDLFAVLDHLGVRTAHLAGLCGGAVLALAAVARQPERFTSLSLWHGDFELGGAAPKTSHQRNLQALMAMAAGGRVGAAQVHAVLCTALLSSVPPDLAHLVLYPYATPELLLTYCRLNGAIMGYDVRPCLPAVRVPVLVVTSRDDGTAHPDGSRHVAARLPGARLVVTEHGDHLSLFHGTPSTLDLAAGFIAAPERAAARVGA